MQLQLKRAKQQRNSRKSVAEEKQGKTGIEEGKGTRRKELDTKTGFAVAAFVDCACLRHGTRKSRRLLTSICRWTDTGRAAQVAHVACCWSVHEERDNTRD